eukprot:gene35801-48140_t
MNIAYPTPAALSPDTIARFRAIVGDKYAVTDQADVHQYVTEDRNLFRGTSPLVLRPGSTAEVAAICKLASETRTALVPQGGNTGLVGGQTPYGGEVVLSLRRMDRLRDLDLESNTMTVEAGMILQNAQARARHSTTVVCRLVGSDEATSGSLIAKADRIWPYSSGTSHSARWAGVAKRCSSSMLP